MALGQTSALDRDQQAYAARKAKERRTREADLWRFILKHPDGRAFVWDVLLADVGYDQPLGGISDTTPGFLIEQATLRNLALHWLNNHIRRNRALYLSMLEEAAAREDVERREEETQRAAWARGDEDDSNE
jgi:hypothetical protein